MAKAGGASGSFGSITTSSKDAKAVGAGLGDWMGSLKNGKLPLKIFQTDELSQPAPVRVAGVVNSAAVLGVPRVPEVILLVLLSQKLSVTAVLTSSVPSPIRPSFVVPVGALMKTDA